MQLKFTKMQATGNDFVVVDNRDGRLDMETMVRLTPILCDRRFGVGADGTLFLCSSDKVDFMMVYRNADGSDAGMCGNGGRAISLFASVLGLGDLLTFEVHGVSYNAQVKGNEVDLHFVGLTCMPRTHQTNEGMIYELYTGTEHIVVPVQEAMHGDLQLIRSKGRELRYSHLFAPKGTNVNFCTFRHDGSIFLSTYERGVEDRTLACGTGSIATALIGTHLQMTDTESTNFDTSVESPGGVLNIRFKRNPSTGTYHDIYLSGEANFVFEGSINV